MVGGDEGDSGLLAAMGIPESMWEQMRDKAHLAIWPENWSAIEVFAAMQTQWRTGMAGATGLDYAALPAVMDLLQIEDRTQAFKNVRVMEIEALEIFRLKHGQ